MDSLISIIIPIFNTEKYLTRCIDSVLNQTYKNIEILLIDDGASDNSPTMCDNYALNDSRVRVFHNSNGGLSDARNFGIEKSTGEYLVFVDSDDYISSSMIEILYNQIILDNSDISISSFNYVSPDGSIMDLKADDKVISNEVITTLMAYDRLCGPHKTIYIVAWNKLYKKQLFDNIKYPLSKQHEDLMVAHLLYEKCASISCINLPLYNYVQHHESIMGKGFNIKHLDMAEAYLIHTEFFSEKRMWYNAVFCLKYVRRLLAIGRFRLNMENATVINRFKELKKWYNKIFFKVLMHTKTFKTFKYTLLFYFSPKLYQKYWEGEERNGL